MIYTIRLLDNYFTNFMCRFDKDRNYMYNFSHNNFSPFLLFVVTSPP